MNNESEKKMRKAFGWLEKPLRSFADDFNNFDYRIVATTFSNFETGLKKAAENQPQVPPDVWDNVQDILADPSHWREMKSSCIEQVQEMKQKAAVDQRHSMIVRLIAEADEQVPLISYLAIANYIEDQSSFVRQLCEPADLLQIAEEETGEIKARALIRAVEEVSKHLYEPYLWSLWCLSCFAKKILPKARPKFGNLVKETGGRLASYPGLVEPEIARLRNAAAHATWRYIPTEGSLVLWDANSDGKVTWNKSLSVSELHTIVKDVYQISGETIYFVGLRYVIKSIWLDSGLLDSIAELAPDLFGKDDARRVIAEQKSNERFEPVFRPLKEFLQSVTI